jgi:hypothetical protein
MDTVQGGLVLHLGDLEVQMRACEQTVGLLKREGVFWVMGQQVGVFEPVLMEPKSGSWMYKRNAEF